jgi:hypothetical protein
MDCQQQRMLKRSVSDGESPDVKEKHAFGLVTEGRRKKKRPYLVYLFAEPKEHAAKRQSHREEIARFAAAVGGAEVGFAAMRYREWLATWPDADSELARHRAAIIERFRP